MAAMKSPLFKVAEYGLEEMNYYPIRLYWNFLQPGSQPLGNNEKGYAEKQTNVLFPAGCLLPATKVIKFSKKEGIELLVTYDPPVDGFNKYIAYYKTPAQTPK
jgi:heat shock protein 4